MPESMPRLEMIVIGDELLDGRTHEKNSHHLAGRCRARGLCLTHVAFVSDQPDDIVAAVLDACRRSTLVVVSGGLGPTIDDRTRHAVAKAAGVDLKQDVEASERLEEKYRARRKVMNRSNLRQAWFPEGAEVLENDVGTADAFALRIGDSRLVCLPGIPTEFRILANRYVVDAVAGQASRCYRRFHLFGAGESALADLVEHLHLPSAVKTTWNAHFPVVTLELSSFRKPELLDAAARRAQEALAPWLYVAESRNTAEPLVYELTNQKLTLSTIESCTGGFLASMVTDIPGASKVFSEGFVTYSNAAKTRAVGVEDSILNLHGAVSPETARAMAEGARATSGSDISLSLTGIAGPDGGSDEKPVGLVYVACATAEETIVLKIELRGIGRLRFKKAAAAAAAFLGLRTLQGRVNEMKHVYGVQSIKRHKVSAATS